MNKHFIDKYFWHGIIIVIVIGVLANLYIWFSPRTEEALELPSYPVKQVSLGKTLYEATCATCHGMNGAGYATDTISAPALDATEHAWHHTDAQIRNWIRGGIGRMPAVGADLSDKEIDAVLAYIKQWWEPEQLARQTENSRLNP